MRTPPNESLRTDATRLVAMKISLLILFALLTGCSTGSQRTTDSRSVLSLEYWHAPPSVTVLKDSLRVGMSEDDFARLVGISEPAYISCMTSHLVLPDGILSTRHDSGGSLLWWEIETLSR
jgi:hypothetical protein